MNVIKNKKVAIIGGGPGGLTLARLLQINGADVKVYERDLHKDARPKGATLDLHEESGLRALSEAGLMDAFNANYRPGADKIRIMDKHGNIAKDEHHGEHETFRPEIDRGPLQQILLDSLEPDTVVWDSQFTGLSYDGNSCSITFKNGNTATADMIIGADGANSKVRPYLTPIKAFFSGYVAVEGAVYDTATVIPKMHELLNGGKIFAFGDEKTLIVSAKGDGSLVFYTGFKAEENWVKDSGLDFDNKEQITAWFKNEYPGWDPMWLQLFEQATTPFIPRTLYCMPYDQQWEALPYLTILGDAAHMMPPYAGEGVNMAMLDAVELCECLCNAHFPDTQYAIAVYENEMRRRGAAAAQDSMESSAALHAPDAISFMVNIMGGTE